MANTVAKSIMALTLFDTAIVEEGREEGVASEVIVLTWNV